MSTKVSLTEKREIIKNSANLGLTLDGEPAKLISTRTKNAVMVQQSNEEVKIEVCWTILNKNINKKRLAFKTE